MSLVTDSPVHSSSSDDFAAFLDASLDSASSEETEDPNHLETQKRCLIFLVCKSPRSAETEMCLFEFPLYSFICRIKRRKVEKMEDVEEVQVSTSHTSSPEKTAGKFFSTS